MNKQMNTMAMIAVHVANIYNWGVARNITIANGASMNAQLRKGAQEVVETAIAWGKKDNDGILDGVGDIITCIIQAMRVGGGSPGGISTTLAEFLSDREYCYDQDGGNKPEKSLELIADALVGNSPTRALQYTLDFVLVIAGYGEEGVFVESYLEQALAKAWNDIKDRKGTMIDGQFVKEQ